MKIFKRILIDIVIILAGCVIGVLLPFKLIGEVNEIALFPFDEHLWNHTFDVINSILLLVTLLTAIFKEQILDKIYRAKFEVEKNIDYREIVEHTEQGSIANYYEKVMCVQNVGNRPAINCRLILDSLSFKSESDYYETEVDFKEAEILPQSLKPSNNQLKPQGTISFPMFRVLPKVAAHDEIPERPMLFQIGNNEIEIKQGKTDYSITFHVEAENIQSTTNKIVIHWNGKWQNRKTEMDKVLSIEYLS